MASDNCRAGATAPKRKLVLTLNIFESTSYGTTGAVGSAWQTASAIELRLTALVELCDHAISPKKKSRR